jgi:hypothetical protein
MRRNAITVSQESPYAFRAGEDLRQPATGTLMDGTGNVVGVEEEVGVDEDHR